MATKGPMMERKKGSVDTAADKGNTNTSASTLEGLISRLNSTSGGYTPLTEDQIKQQANQYVASQYDTQRLAAQQQAESTDLALEQQLSGLQSSYDRQREQARENYAQAVSQHDRNLVNKGMQRSSYGAATRSNINLEGNKAQSEIDRAQTEQEGNIGAQRTKLQQQLAQQLAQLNINQQRDAQSYADQLRAREYERGQTAYNNHNSLALQIAQLQQQNEASEISQAQWQAEFNARYGNSGGGGYSGGGSGSDNGGGFDPRSAITAAGAATALGAAFASGTNSGSTPTSKSPYAQWMNTLNGKPSASFLHTSGAGNNSNWNRRPNLYEKH